jgi:hypothetical protein
VVLNWDESINLGAAAKIYGLAGFLDWFADF